MNDTASGVILKEADYRERDALITVLTKEYGKISFAASGVRKMSSRNAAGILPYTLAEIEFDHKPGKTLFRLKRARTRKLYRRLHEDLTLSAAASVLTGIADALTLNGDEDGEFREKAELLEKSMDLLQEGNDPDLVIPCFLAGMAELFGVGADVDECVRCGRQEAVTFDPEEGGFLCAECAGARPVMSRQDLMRLRRIVKGGIPHFDLVKSGVTPSKEDAQLLMRMLEKHTGIVIRAFSFYRKLIV